VLVFNYLQKRSSETVSFLISLLHFTFIPYVLNSFDLQIIHGTHCMIAFSLTASIN